ncbi:type II secretion system protein [Luteimonas sp. MHLX1A]|uniref:type II secretion system protein n=1 Tax=Alterluteimonas muca TaxID=2878684 RepID=UPI0021068B9D|nr:type II secretion system protein [Luteimonas sp. MHLX1A]MCD9047784.1 type II secretion system GspH family protein [Luteimonas sp. MHLX1A]
MSRSSESGMTLLEMLVVLVIASMALALGFQSLGQWRRANAAIETLTLQGRQMMLSRSWLESSVRGLHPVEDTPFAGQGEQWTGVTLQPVLATQGGATAVSWRIERGAGGVVVLSLEEGSQALELPLGEVADARFEYLDPEGGLHPQWPPALGLNDHLPAAVGLVLEGAPGDQRVWLAPVIGMRNPVPVMYEPETD